MCEQMSDAKVIPFRIEPNGISEKLIQKLLRKGERYGLTDIIPITTDKIVVAEWVHLKCRYGCSQFNTSWCCPPVTPDFQDTTNLMREYSLALLLVGVTRRVNFYRDNQRKRVRQLRGWKGTVSIERLLFMEGFYKAFSLVARDVPCVKPAPIPRTAASQGKKDPPLSPFQLTF